MTRQQRLDWVFPSATGELEPLDPEDPDERTFLIEAEHPEYADALRAGSEIEVDGHVINPTLHVALHEVVANQILELDPPEAWETAQRMVGLGYERHEVLHMLASVVSDQIHGALTDREPVDIEPYKAALAGLPDTWEAMREAHEHSRGPMNRAERRAAAARARRRHPRQ